MVPCPVTDPEDSIDIKELQHIDKWCYFSMARRATKTVLKQLRSERIYTIQRNSAFNNLPGGILGTWHSLNIFVFISSIPQSSEKANSSDQYWIYWKNFLEWDQHWLFTFGPCNPTRSFMAMLTFFPSITTSPSFLDPPTHKSEIRNLLLASRYHIKPVAHPPDVKRTNHTSPTIAISHLPCDHCHYHRHSTHHPAEFVYLWYALNM